MTLDVNTDEENLIDSQKKTYEFYTSYDNELSLSEFAAGIENDYIKPDSRDTMSISGFASKPNGSGKKYPLNKTIKNLEKEHGWEVVLYAQWTKGYKEHHISYDKTPDTGVSLAYINGAAASYSSRKAVSIKNPSRTGYIFDGWNVKKLESKGSGAFAVKDLEDGDAEIVENEKTKAITIKSGNVDLSLSPVWRPITYNVTVFDGATKLEDKSRANVPYNTADISIEGLSRDGYEFLGYNLSKNGKGKQLKIDQNGDYSLAELATKDKSNVKVYAIWKAKTYDITYNYYDGDLGEYGTPGTELLDVKNANITTVTVGKEYKFKNPSKPGYTFIGWENPGNSEHVIKDARTSKYTRIDANNFDDVVLAGRFVENRYSLKISSNGGVVATGNESIGKVGKAFSKVERADVAYNRDDTLADIKKYAGKFSKKGYIFMGFALDAKGKTMLTDEEGNLVQSKYNINGKLVNLSEKNKSTATVYAVWEKVATTVPEITECIKNDNITVSYKVNEKSTAKASYEIQYSTSWLFRNAQVVSCDDLTGSIDSNKNYYIRVRQVRTDSVGNSVYSKWSKTVKVR